MMIMVSDDVYIAAHKIVKMTADYQRNRITILTDDGKEHLITSTSASQKMDNLVAKINSALAIA